MKLLIVLSILVVSYLVTISNNQVTKPFITILLTGDVMLGRTVMTTSLDKNDPTYPFREVSDVLKSADITFINLENPVVTNCPETVVGLIFCADPKMVQGLTYAGVDIVNLANNHSKNYGQSGVDQTVNYLKQANIASIGLNNVTMKQSSNVKFAFVGFDKSQQANPKLTQDEKNLLIKANLESDVLIVAMHWGVEYQNKALPGVRALAKELVDLGAEVVVGHHPHWVQDWETIGDTPVFYSLGNFIFDQMWSENTRKGMAVRLTFDGVKLVKQEFLPVFMQNHAQPRFVNNLN